MIKEQVYRKEVSKLQETDSSVHFAQKMIRAHTVRVKILNEMTEHEILKLLPDGRYRLLNVNIRKGIPKSR